MQQIAGLILSFIFIFIAAIHIYWGLGGRWALKGALPTAPDQDIALLNPGPMAFIIVILGLLVMALFAVIKSGLVKVTLPVYIDRYGLIVIAGIFLLRSIGEFKYVGLFKKIKSTEFGRKDTKYYIPLCLVISLLAIILHMK